MISLKNFVRLSLFVLIAGLSSCNSSKNVLYMQDARINQEEPIVNINDIKVQPRDQLSINVSCKEPEVAALFNLMQTSKQLGSQGGATTMGNSVPYTVDSYGDINFPVLGKIHIAGLTRQEISEKIANMLIQGDWVNDPIVTVEFVNLHFSVLGEVGAPGNYSITNDKITLLEALSMAGDLSIFGKRDIMVIREVDGKRVKYKVDLRSDDLFNSPVFYLRQNDVVYVEPNHVRAGQSTVNENNFKSVSLWISLASFLMTIGILVFK